jgi:hypothetical protein
MTGRANAALGLAPQAGETGWDRAGQGGTRLNVLRAISGSLAQRRSLPVRRSSGLHRRARTEAKVSTGPRPPRRLLRKRKSVTVILSGKVGRLPGGRRERAASRLLNSGVAP